MVVFRCLPIERYLLLFELFLPPPLQWKSVHIYEFMCYLIIQQYLDLNWIINKVIFLFSIHFLSSKDDFSFLISIYTLLYIDEHMYFSCILLIFLTFGLPVQHTNKLHSSFCWRTLYLLLIYIFISFMANYFKNFISCSNYSDNVSDLRSTF